MTVVPIFPELYFQYKVKNHQEFKKYLLETYLRETSETPSITPNWNCNTKSLSVDASLLVPNLSSILEEFCVEINENLDFSIKGSWLNFYDKNDFQEIHGHTMDGTQLSLVYFVQYNPKDDGEFYFFHKNYSDRELSGLYPILNKYPAMMSNWYPTVNEGDVLIFPSYLLHGVKPHMSDTKRITLAVNFSFEIT